MMTYYGNSKKCYSENLLLVITISLREILVTVIGLEVFLLQVVFSLREMLCLPQTQKPFYYSNISLS